MTANGMLRRQIYKYAHRVIIRRINVLSIDDIEELSKVDIIIMSYPPERCGLYDGARWDQEAYDAVKTELNERGLLVRTRYYQRPPSRFFELISPLEIPVGEPPNWYDVWQKRKGL